MFAEVSKNSMMSFIFLNYEITSSRNFQLSSDMFLWQLLLGTLSTARIRNDRFMKKDGHPDMSLLSSAMNQQQSALYIDSQDQFLEPVTSLDEIGLVAQKGRIVAIEHPAVVGRIRPAPFVIVDNDGVRKVQNGPPQKTVEVVVEKVVVIEELDIILE